MLKLLSIYITSHSTTHDLSIRHTSDIRNKLMFLHSACPIMAGIVWEDSRAAVTHMRGWQSFAWVQLKFPFTTGVAYSGSN